MRRSRHAERATNREVGVVAAVLALNPRLAPGAPTVTDDLLIILPDEDAEPVFDPDGASIADPDVDAADAPEG